MGSPLRYGDCCKERCRRIKKYLHKETGQTRYFEYCINKGCGWKGPAYYYEPGKSYPTYVPEEPKKPWFEICTYPWTACNSEKTHAKGCPLFKEKKNDEQ